MYIIWKVTRVNRFVVLKIKPVNISKYYYFTPKLPTLLKTYKINSQHQFIINITTRAFDQTQCSYSLYTRNQIKQNMETTPVANPTSRFQFLSL